MSATNDRAAWMIAGACGCVALCLVLMTGGVAVYLLFNADRVAPTPTVPPTSIIAATPAARPPKKAVELPKDESACEQAGGKWGKSGLASTEQCNLPTSDAGKVCSAFSECEGLCLADLPREQWESLTRTRTPIPAQGKCAPWRVTVGCVAIVENGMVRGILCVD